MLIFHFFICGDGPWALENGVNLYLVSPSDQYFMGKFDPAKFKRNGFNDTDGVHNKKAWKKEIVEEIWIYDSN